MFYSFDPTDVYVNGIHKRIVKNAEYPLRFSQTKFRV